MQATKKYSIIILAAGSSSRLGHPKQLVKLRNKTLLKHVIDEAIATVGNQVIVVTGANNESLENELNSLPVLSIYNEQWQEGMASSIHAGLLNLIRAYPDVEAVIFAVCDQPFVSAKLFSQLIETHEQSCKGIIASFYNDIAGVPVLFAKKYFNDLLQLKGEQGAKVLLRQYTDDLQTVEFNDGNIDIDTAEDLSKINS